MKSKTKRERKTTTNTKRIDDEIEIENEIKHETEKENNNEITNVIGIEKEYIRIALQNMPLHAARGGGHVNASIAERLFDKYELPVEFTWAARRP